MMRFEDKYFQSFAFTRDQINKNLDNTVKDLKIAHKDTIPVVDLIKKFIGK